MKQLYLHKQPRKFLENLQHSDKKLGLQISNEIDFLLENPINSSIKKLSGHKGVYRSRVGKHRIIYRFDEKILYILLIESRDRVYEKLGIVIN